MAVPEGFSPRKRKETQNTHLIQGNKGITRILKVFGIPGSKISRNSPQSGHTNGGKTLLPPLT
jgi:hypothetical protein